MTAQYDKYYEHYFRRVNIPTKEAFEEAASSYSACFQKSLPSDKNIKILDVGCGMGHFLYFLKKAGYTNYWGIDISTAQVSFVRENITERVEVADVFDYLKAICGFDVIVANDVLEHIPKDKILDLLNLIYQALEPNGLFFAKTPNMSNPFSLRFRYVDYTHDVGFTEESLRYVLSITGFEDIEITGAPSQLRSFKSWIAAARSRAIRAIIAQALKAQGYGSPSILDSNLIVMCKKK
jgi:2-polyprenyl-3-methyl-5-hydroxy-6-metoxy-1,4-benzoquinol methylase